MKMRRTANTRNVPARAGKAPVAAPVAWRDRPRAWRDQHLYSLFSSLGRLAARPWASALTVLVLGVALALPLLLHVALDQVRGLSEGLREAREITVFLEPAATAGHSAAFADELRARPDVADVTVRTPDEGMAEFRRLSGFDNALDVLGANPLPMMLIITPLEAGGGTDEPQLVADLRAESRVDLVQYDALWRRRLGAILDFGARSVGVLGALLALAALLVIGNTVRLDIQGRREEIAVMQLIGASNGFVRRPVLYTGFWYGLGGGVLALAIVVAIGFALGGPLRRLLASYGQAVSSGGLDIHPVLALAVIAASAVLGWIGAWLVTSGHLGEGNPDP
jgi:cell division transport system permease protein